MGIRTVEFDSNGDVVGVGEFGRPVDDDGFIVEDYSNEPEPCFNKQDDPLVSELDKRKNCPIDKDYLTAEQVQICAGSSIFRPATIKEKQLMALLRQMKFCNEDSFLRYVWSHRQSVVGLHYANRRNNDMKPLAYSCGSEDEALNKGLERLAEDVRLEEEKILSYKKLHLKFFGNKDLGSLILTRLFTCQSKASNLILRKGKLNHDSIAPRYFSQV